MASQFDEVMGILNTILAKLRYLEEKIEAWGPEPEEELFGEDPFDESDYLDRLTVSEAKALRGLDEEDEILRPQMPGATRTRVEVREQDGTSTLAMMNDLSDQMQQIIRLSVERGRFFQVYRGQDGQLRITAEEDITNMVRRGDNSLDTDTGLDA